MFEYGCVGAGKVLLVLQPRLDTVLVIPELVLKRRSVKLTLIASRRENSLPIVVVGIPSSSHTESQIDQAQLIAL